MLDIATTTTMTKGMMLVLFRRFLFMGFHLSFREFNVGICLNLRAIEIMLGFIQFRIMLPDIDFDEFKKMVELKRREESDGHE